jgi:hypothetical protein
MSLAADVIDAAIKGGLHQWSLTQPSVKNNVIQLSDQSARC